MLVHFAAIGGAGVAAALAVVATITWRSLGGVVNDGIEASGIE